MRIAALSSLLAAFPLVSCAGTEAALEPLAVSSQAIAYGDGEITFEGFIARPAGPVKERPGVIVVHEWWGHNDHARGRARQLAENGYVALAVDMYGGGKLAEHPSDAAEFMAEATADAAVMEARFRAGLALLHAQPDVDASRTGALGYCMGGAVCLNMLRMGVDLDAVASIHGLLDSDISAEPSVGGSKTIVLVASGGADPMASEASVAAFEAEMATLDLKELRTLVFPGVLHAFSNPDATRLGEEFDLPLAYDADADEDSWAATLRLFRDTLGPRD